MCATVTGRAAEEVEAGLTGATNVGGDDRGVRLTVAEGVTLREVCAGENTNECRDSDGGTKTTSRNVGGATTSTQALAQLSAS